MDIKKLLIGGIVAGVLFFLLGWLVYGNLIQHYMHVNPGKKGHLERPEMSMLYIAIGSLMRGFLLAYIFTRGNINTLVDGLVSGAVIGFLMVGAADILTYGTTFIMSKRGIAGDLAAFTAISAVTGAVLAIVTGKSKN